MACNPDICITSGLLSGVLSSAELAFLKNLPNALPRAGTTGKTTCGEISRRADTRQ